jgi:hypothetical protein
MSFLRILFFVFVFLSLSLSLSLLVLLRKGEGFHGGGGGDGDVETAYELACLMGGGEGIDREVFLRVVEDERVCVCVCVCMSCAGKESVNVYRTIETSHDSTLLGIFSGLQRRAVGRYV